jgi:two-component system, NarL family, sensor histidine kinase UhpB
VRLEVVDDGSGPAEGTVEGSGLRGMRERALSIGAGLSIGADGDRGFRIRMDVSDTGTGD